MIASLQGSIASAVRRTLRFLRISSAPANPVAFEKLSSDGTDIERYIQSLVNGYNARGAARMQDYRVEELYHCKQRTDVGNEYVSAKVLGPDSTTPFYIIFERRGYIDSDTPATSAEPLEIALVHEQALPSAQVGEIVHAKSDYAIRTGNVNDKSTSYLQGRHTDDNAFMSFTLKANEIHKTVAFQHPIPLYMVAVLAVTVHRSHVQHDSTDASCYFYAAAIMAVMEQLYQNNSKTTRAKVGRSSTFQRTPIPISGTYEATMIKPEAFQAIVDSYKVDLDNFENNARSKDTQIEQEIIRANREAARADREAKRAMEAEVKHARLLEELAAAKAAVAQSERLIPVTGA